MNSACLTNTCYPICLFQLVCHCMLNFCCCSLVQWPPVNPAFYPNANNSIMPPLKKTKYAKHSFFPTHQPNFILRHYIWLELHVYYTWCGLKIHFAQTNKTFVYLEVYHVTTVKTAGYKDKTSASHFLYWNAGAYRYVYVHC